MLAMTLPMFPLADDGEDATLFFALRLGNALQRLAPLLHREIGTRFGTTAALSPIQWLHVRLADVGPTSGLVSRLQAARKAAASTWFAPVELTFTHISSLSGVAGSRGPAAVALLAGDSDEADGAETVRNLRAELTGRTQLAGLKSPRHEAKDIHVALFNDGVDVPPTRLARPISVLLDAFCLVRSDGDGPDYVELGRWHGRKD